MPSKKSDKANTEKSLYAWAAVRIVLGFTFVWAFVDKLIGLGFSTCRDAKSGAVSYMCEKAWINGGSPTDGFLKSSKGPFQEIYNSMAGNELIVWLFMLGLLLIGLALLLGIGMKIAVTTGSILLFMMWAAVLPPKSNPMFDSHIAYIFALLGIYFSNSQQKWGLRNWWVNQDIVKKFPILE